jgi:hypothetical protein
MLLSKATSAIGEVIQANWLCAPLMLADHETDVIIQSTVRNELKGVSVLTVAHRLQTVMDYDRIVRSPSTDSFLHT